MNLSNTKIHGRFIKKYVNDMKKDEDITFDQLLINLKLQKKTIWWLFNPAL